LANFIDSSIDWVDIEISFEVFFCVASDTFVHSVNAIFAPANSMPGSTGAACFTAIIDRQRREPTAIWPNNFP
jgi:hypothetical protein